RIERLCRRQHAGLAVFGGFHQHHHPHGSSPVCLPGRRNRWPVGNDVAAGWTSTSPAKLASTAAAGRGLPAPAVAATGGPCIPHAGATSIPSLPATYA